MRDDSQEHNRFVLPPGIRHNDSSAALADSAQDPTGIWPPVPFCQCCPSPSQPGLAEPWKSPNFSFWYFKANKPPVKKSTHPSASCDLGQHEHRFYQAFLCSVAVENAQHQTREVKLNKMPLKTELLRQHYIKADQRKT